MGFVSGDLIAWRRWWFPPGDQPTLWQGMLPDPEQGNNRFLNRGRSRLADTAQLRARVLLADPGMGKSTELRGEVDQLRSAGAHVAPIDLGKYASTGEVREAIVEAGQTWSADSGPGDLVLAIDGFDEPLVDIGNLADVLADSIDRLDRDRLRVIVACRGSQWSSSLATRFVGWWGEGQVRVLALAPLTARDIAAAAASEGMDGEEFLSAVRVADAGPLAARPITLRLMLGGARSGALPSQRLEVYQRGVAGLASEPNVRRRERRRTGLPLNERIDAARRLAAVSMLTGRLAIVRRATPEQTAAELALDEIAGDEVRLQALDEVWDSALLAGSGAGRTWCHHSIAEYLCAEILATLPTDASWSLLAAPGDPTRLRPQLEETAAWVANLSAGMFDRLVESHPRLLLNPDLPARPPQDRERVGRAVLDRLKRGESVLDRVAGARLDYPGVADDLRLLLDSKQPHWRRRETVVLVGASGLRDLDDNLLAIVKTSSGRTGYDEDVALAVLAARVLTHTDDAAMIRAIRALAGDDAVPGHVRAALITGLFPDRLSPGDLLALVTPRERFSPPFRRTVIPAMQDAIASGAMRAQDLLGWFDDPPNAAVCDQRVCEFAAAAALAAVSEGPSGPAWPQAVRTVLWLVHGPSRLAEWTAEQIECLGVDLRRELSRAVLDGRGDDLLTYELMDRTLLRGEDLLWWLDRLDEGLAGAGDGGLSASAAVRALADVILDNEDLLTMARDRCARSGALAAVAEQGLSAHEVASRRDLRARAKERRRIHEANEAQRYFSQSRLDEALNAGDVLAALDELRHALSLKDRMPGPDGPLLGWTVATADARERTCRLAAAYLAAHEPDLDNFGEVHELAEIVAVLDAHDTALLNGVPDTTRWTRWLGPLLRYAPTSQAVHIALDRALTADPDSVARVLGELIDQDEPARGLVHVQQWLLDALPESMRDQLAAEALKHAGQPDIDPSALAHLLFIGAAGRPSKAAQVALDHLMRCPAPPAGDRNNPAWLRAVTAARSLITGPDLHETFDNLMQVFEEKPPLAVEAVRYLDVRQSQDIWAGLAGDQIGRLYLWARTVMPHRRPEPGVVVTTDRADELPRDLIGVLTSRSDAQSARVLDSLAVATGNVYLRTEAERIRSLVAADAATPPSPQAVLAVLTDPSQRAVTSGPQLAQAVLTELDAIAADLLCDRGLRSTFWERQRPGTNWDGTYVPVEETDLSERLKAELARRLEKRVAVVREVQIQHGLSAAGGDFPDILAITLSTDTTTVTLPLEVKGNWHRDVVTALRTQLADRYLTGPAGTEGVYVVGYFHGDKWRKTDKNRLRDAGKRSIRKLCTDLAAEAQKAATGGRTVHVRVLNIPLDLEVS